MLTTTTSTGSSRSAGSCRSALSTYYQHGAEHVLAAIDARMEQVYVGEYQAVDGLMQLVGEERVSAPALAGQIMAMPCAQAWARHEQSTTPCPLTDFRGISCHCLHGSILSRVGASGKPGAVHEALEHGIRCWSRRIDNGGG